MRFSGGEVLRGEVSSVSLVFCDPDADNRLVAAILYADAALPMEALLARVKNWEQAQKERVVDEYLKRPGPARRAGAGLGARVLHGRNDPGLRGIPDVQRHRMATQTTQGLTPALGFEMPADFEAFGYAEKYGALMTQVAEAHRRLTEAGLADEAAYVLPLATRIRALFTWNLREVTHFVELRSARQGHPSYRKIAQDVYAAVAEAYRWPPNICARI